jgi:hypothetical protein
MKMATGGFRIENAARLTVYDVPFVLLFWMCGTLVGNYRGRAPDVSGIKGWVRITLGEVTLREEITSASHCIAADLTIGHEALVWKQRRCKRGP